MSENETEPEPQPVQLTSRPGNVERGVGNVLKFLKFANAKEVVNVGLLLTNALSPYAKEDYAPELGIGKVMKWFPTRGFGFIRSECSPEDLFAHMTEIEGRFNALTIGKTVSFTRAFNVKRGKFQATKISGAACFRTHKTTRPRGICFDFQKGMCTRGILCRFSHTRTGGRGGRGRNGVTRRGRGGGGHQYNANPYPYNYGGGVYGGMPYGGAYSGFPVMGYGGGAYGPGPGRYPPFPFAGPGAFGAAGGYGLPDGQKQGPGAFGAAGAYDGQNNGSSAGANPMANTDTSPASSPSNGAGGSPGSFATQYMPATAAVPEGAATHPSEAPRFNIRNSPPYSPGRANP